MSVLGQNLKKTVHFRGQIWKLGGKCLSSNMNQFNQMTELWTFVACPNHVDSLKEDHALNGRPVGSIESTSRFDGADIVSMDLVL